MAGSRSKVSASNRQPPSAPRLKAIRDPSASCSTTRSPTRSSGRSLKGRATLWRMNSRSSARFRRVVLGRGPGPQGVEVQAGDSILDHGGKEVVKGEGEVEGLERFAGGAASLSVRGRPDSCGIPADRPAGFPSASA